MKIAAPAGSSRLSVLRSFAASARRSIGFVLVVTLSVFTAQRLDAIQLLPGVHGYGLERSAGLDPNTAGFGSNAVVIEVTTLSGADVPGSFRRAVQSATSPAGLPRIIVFKTSGVIQLDTQVLVQHHNTTIAGQTA
ncbi:MAG TPA: hypothetical protein VHF69_07545, partial [Candidatus Synoicihabitans sp.]|nr:hypothetical protein [Candidatus Synoicihabitans sp.]